MRPNTLRLLRRYLRSHKTFDQLPDKVSIHLNDTHPVLAVPELMRLLLDEHGLDWDTAWAHTQKVFSYTNHTLMHEALETWPVEMMGRILPRHLQIIYDMNSKFLATVTEKAGDDVELLRRLSLVDEAGERRVRMAYVAVLASHSINGVSGLHSELMKQSIFADFARIFPERFNNKTNGVTPRRWLAQANPPLAFTGTRPPIVVSPSRSSFSASPGAHKPICSYQSSSIAVERS